MTAGATNETPSAISHDALLGKSKLYIQRALESKEMEQHDGYQLWAALALELLGKAALALRHPCLVVNPTHQNSLLAAAGIRIGVDIRTISARTVYKRLRHLSREFDQDVMNYCIAMHERRNAELHSGESPFSGASVTNWESRYWQAADLVLRMLELTFFEWLRPDDARISSRIVKQIEEATKRAVSQRMATHRKQVSKAPRRIRSREFRVVYDQLWPSECPACENIGEMVGTPIEEEVVETEFDNLEEEWFDLVNVIYGGGEFICPHCDLHLRNYEELIAAEVEPDYSEEIHRVAEFVEEYNNE